MYFRRVRYRNLVVSVVLLACISFIAYYIYDYYKIPDSPEGNRVTELALPGLDGKPLPISSLRGEIVLIQFWAGWCGPCRFENPELVKLYESFHEATYQSASGFDIYSVSLDVSRTRWLQAIQQDHLVWKNHVSELKGWSSPVAEQFGIRSIPANILIDPEGKIIGRNLSIAALEKYLEKQQSSS